MLDALELYHAQDYAGVTGNTVTRNTVTRRQYSLGNMIAQRHYFLGNSVTARKYCRTQRQQLVSALVARHREYSTALNSAQSLFNVFLS